MKIAFSTLACPDSSWRDITSMATDTGFDGVEVRGLGQDIFAVRAKPFTAGEIDNTIKELKRLRLEIPCFSSHCSLKFAEQRAANKNTLTEYIELAGKTGTPYIRVDVHGVPAAHDAEVRVFQFFDYVTEILRASDLPSVDFGDKVARL
ncbi:hypothetical protein FACS1894202_14920 [Clostridia bacterium]|nr:hypothetical protein FACS1894202_14920 [Clostridia bacterium]